MKKLILALITGLSLLIFVPIPVTFTLAAASQPSPSIARNGRFPTQSAHYFLTSGPESLLYAQGGGIGADIFGWALSVPL